MARRSDWPNNLTPAAVHILLALADADRHGLGIVDEVERRTDGDVKLGPGTLYGTIKRMRAARLVSEASESRDEAGDDPRRRYYRITNTGRAALERETRRMERFTSIAREKAVLGVSEES